MEPTIDDIKERAEKSYAGELRGAIPMPRKNLVNVLPSAGGIGLGGGYLTYLATNYFGSHDPESLGVKAGWIIAACAALYFFPKALRDRKEDLADIESQTQEVENEIVRIRAQIDELIPVNDDEAKEQLSSPAPGDNM